MFPIVSFQVTLLYLILTLTSIASSTSNLLLNKEITTYIDISSQLVLLKNEITVNNPNDEPIENYLFVVDPHLMKNLSYIEAKNNNFKPLHVNKKLDDDSLLKYDILFQSPLMPGDTTIIRVNSVIINYLESYPKNVKQSEKHLVLFSFNVYYFSVYFTEMQTTFLHTGATQVSYVDGAKYTIPDNANYGLQYGPFFNIDSMSEHPSVVHYENVAPFMAVEKLDRYIQISHWGYLKVWEHITIVHKGPTFKGSYERSHNDPPDTRIESYSTFLPGNAFDIYLKDEIGQLSSYDVDDSSLRYTVVNIKPRFVLYGGWKTYYELGYSLNIFDYLTHNENNNIFTLKFPLVDKIFPNMVIEEAKINIIIPEGAEPLEVSPYVELENSTDRYCYVLDVFCRSVVSFKKFNIVEMHIHNFSITYTFSQWFLLLKPFVIAVAFSVMFLTFIVKMHTLFSITDNVNEKVPKVEAKCTERNENKKTISKPKQKKAKVKKANS